MLNYLVDRQFMVNIVFYEICSTFYYLFHYFDIAAAVMQCCIFLFILFVLIDVCLQKSFHYFWSIINSSEHKPSHLFFSHYIWVYGLRKANLESFEISLLNKMVEKGLFFQNLVRFSKIIENIHQNFQI